MTKSESEPPIQDERARGPWAGLGRIAREPLLHFVCFGAAIYAITALFGDNPDEADDRSIRVTAGQIAWFEDSWEKRWGRPPTPAERAGLIDEYVRETVLYREALAMGLDQDDTVVRRRLAQKLEFLSQDLLAPPEPSEDELRAWFDERRETYREPAVVTFTQVFVDPDRREERTHSDASAILDELRALPSPGEAGSGWGDPFMLQRYYPERSEPEIAKLFGSGFAREVASLPVEGWQGPVLSGYGVHLVYVHHREDPRDVDYAAVRERVANDWADARRKALDDEFYQQLRARYSVTIEGPVSADSVAVRDVPGR